MSETQVELFNKIRSMAEVLSRHQIEYWKAFSSFDTWQFWVVAVALIAPLIVLLVFIDRNQALLLGFFGFNYHVWFSYVDQTGINLGLWEYPYQILPFLASFALDASFVPICFMLLYQWALNRQKNLYLHAILLSTILAFVLKPMMVHFHFFHMYYGINYFHLFLFYYAFFLVSKLITNVFIWLKKTARS